MIQIFTNDQRKRTNKVWKLSMRKRKRTRTLCTSQIPLENLGSLGSPYFMSLMQCASLSLYTATLHHAALNLRFGTLRAQKSLLLMSYFNAHLTVHSGSLSEPLHLYSLIFLCFSVFIFMQFFSFYSVILSNSIHLSVSKAVCFTLLSHLSLILVFCYHSCSAGFCWVLLGSACSC